MPSDFCQSLLSYLAMGNYLTVTVVGMSLLFCETVVKLCCSLLPSNFDPGDATRKDNSTQQGE